MKIAIVTHCYAEKIPNFAQALCYQLSSFILHPPQCELDVWVCRLLHGDSRTQDVIDYFVDVRDKPFHLISYGLTLEELGRRSIGRNIVSLMTTADLVWHTDVDHIFCGCLQKLVELEWPTDQAMIFPKKIQIHKDWVTGDECTNLIGDKPRVVDIKPVDFIPKKYGRAIGGAQIVRGDFAREHGYLEARPEWRKPTDKTFGDFIDDVRYRRFCDNQGGGVQGVDLPGLYRIRHTKTTYQ